MRELAPRLEAAGFHTLWVNDTPAGDALASIAVAAEVTATLQLATGVIPIDRRPPLEIAASVDRLGLPLDRLTIGIGSGRVAKGALAVVGEAVAVLRDEIGVPVVVGALGPKMRELAAREADGVVLNWLTPDAAAEAAADAQAASLTRPRPAHVVQYVRTIVDPAAREALVAEARRYEAVPAYAANFERLGVTALETTLDASAMTGASESDAGSLLDEYLGAVDEVVIRAITAEQTIDDYAQFIDHPLLAERLQLDIP
ncbi:LLM class flavin-dependent oxidoreductase [Ruicaihuangia caeni]|uniref:LLM class flavin-dependent oxidoreductase n=1 Tax=Ruicaihuangia caeni TaxID=3042517 RepID=A0AAW6T8V0_9MICO|nr:LLM class flavin-dependent oxidoreductase [Klugiella sp. YN-L-19]MDI2098468.1 LLM class flavin-dependent oxidoreductase [Klugiella sp. YN-L-19]